MTKSHTFPEGSTLHSAFPRPFFVRRSSGKDGYYGSLEAARRSVREQGGDAIFFDYGPGCGRLIERASR